VRTGAKRESRDLVPLHSKVSEGPRWVSDRIGKIEPDAKEHRPTSRSLKGVEPLTRIAARGLSKFEKYEEDLSYHGSKPIPLRQQEGQGNQGKSFHKNSENTKGTYLSALRGENSSAQIDSKGRSSYANKGQEKQEYSKDQNQAYST